MFIPKYFVLSTLLITSLLRTRSGKSLPILFSCRLWPITIYSLLLAYYTVYSMQLQQHNTMFGLTENRDVEMGVCSRDDLNLVL